MKGYAQFVIPSVLGRNNDLKIDYACGSTLRLMMGKTETSVRLNDLVEVILAIGELTDEETL